MVVDSGVCSFLVFVITKQPQRHSTWPQNRKQTRMRTRARTRVLYLARDAARALDDEPHPQNRRKGGFPGNEETPLPTRLREATARAEVDSQGQPVVHGVDLLASRFGLPPPLHQTGAMVC